MARFPSNPTQGQQYFDPTSGITYTWDGYKWETTSAPYNSGATGATGLAYGVYAFGRADSSGDLIPGYGSGVIKESRISTGVYRYKLTQEILTGSFSVNAIAIDDPRATATVENLQTGPETTFDVRISVNTSGGNPPTQRAAAHSFTVYAADGPPGTGSAFESWLNVGNFGTEQDFLDSLVGPQGDGGAQGVTGATGPEGPVGATGPQGIDGTGIRLKGTLNNENDLAALPALSSPDDDNTLYIIANGPTGPNNKFGAGEGAVWNGGDSTLSDLSAWDNVGNIQGPQGPQGATGATGIQGATGPQGIPSTDGGFFLVIGERNSTPTANSFFAFGNGASSQNDFAVPEDCKLSKLSVKAQNNFTSFKAAIVRNGVQLPRELSFTNDNQGTVIFSGPDEINVFANDPENGGQATTIAVKCTDSTGSSATGQRATASLYFVTEGARGATGVPGPPGPPNGATGPRGASGPPGPIGSSGFTGATGPKGDIGIGVPGATGSQGATGPQGGPGPVGTKVLGTLPNEAALPPTGTIGEGYVITAPNVEPPDSVFVWDGSSWSSIGPIQGPPGATGVPGPTGATGLPLQSFAKFYLKSENTINNLRKQSANSPDVLDPVNEVIRFRTFNVIEELPAIQQGGYAAGSVAESGGNPRAGTGRGGIVVPETGIYEITVSAAMKSGATRPSVGVRLSISGTDGETGPEDAQPTSLPEYAAMGYIRSSGHTDTSVTLTTIASLVRVPGVQEDQIQVQFAGLANSGAVALVGGKSFITIKRIA